jgi:hypothetical protein
MDNLDIEIKNISDTVTKEKKVKLLNHPPNEPRRYNYIVCLASIPVLPDKIESYQHLTRFTVLCAERHNNKDSEVKDTWNYVALGDYEKCVIGDSLTLSMMNNNYIANTWVYLSVFKGENFDNKTDINIIND